MISPSDIEKVKGLAEVDPLGPENRCRDHDEDCEGVPCKTSCWLYDPEQGWCPYLLPTPRSKEYPGNG